MGSTKFRDVLWLGWTILLATEVSAKTGFYKQNEYVYEYTGQVLTGLPNAGKDKTAVGIKTNIIIQPTESDLIVQFNDIRTYSGIVEGYEDTSDEIPLPYTLLKTGDKDLKRPFKIVYQANSDEFKGIEVHQEDVPWSINIKKAFTVFFNVRLDRQLSKRQGYFARQTTGNFDPIDVIESGIEGTCKTKYIYQEQPWPNNPKVHVLNVTKIRDEKSCKDRPIWRQTINEPQKCSSCESSHETFVKHGSVSTYNAYEESGQYVLQSAENHGIAHITPFPPDGDHLRITEYQKLTLRNKKPSSGQTGGMWVPRQSVQQPSMLITPEDVNLKARYKRNIKSSKGSKVSPITPLKQIKKDEEPKDKVQRLLDELNHNFEDVYRIPSSDALVSISKIVDNVRLLTYEDIQKLYRTYENEEGKRRLFIDTIVMAGTEASFLYVKYLIEQRKITGEHAAQVISSLPAYILEPQPAILEEIWAMCKGRMMKENRQIYATTLLAFGELVNQACVPKQNPKTTKPHHIKVSGCPKTLTGKYLQELINMFEHSTHIWEKSTIMYTIYHMRLNETLDYLIPYLQHKIFNMPSSLASEMILSLAEVGPGRQEDIAKYLLPIFYNTTVPAQVRITAFELLSYTTTSQELMNQLALSTWTEPDTDVATYVYSYLKDVGNITVPCWIPMGVRSKQALKLAKPVPIGLLTSRMGTFSTYADKWSLGSTFSYSLHHSSKSLFPSSAHLHIGTELAGHYSSTLEISAFNDGMQNLLDFLIGPKADYMEKTKFSDIFKYDTSAEDDGETSPHYKGEFKVTPRKDEPFYTRIKTTTLQNRHRIFFLDENTLDDIRNSGILPVKKDLYSSVRDGIPINYTNIQLLVDTQIKFSSVIGVPMKVEFKMPMYSDVRGKISIELSKTGITNALSHFIFKPEITTTVAMNGWVAVSTDVPFDKKTVVATVTSNAFRTIPFHGYINADLTQKSFTASVRKPSTQPHTAPHTALQPFCKVEIIPKLIVIDQATQTKVEHIVNRTKTQGKLDTVTSPTESSWGSFIVKAQTDMTQAEHKKLMNDVLKLLPLHLFIFGWAPSSFRLNTIEVALSPGTSDTDQVELSVNWKHSPSPFEEELWRGKSLLQRFRLWNLFPEWTDFPDVGCKDFQSKDYIQATTQSPKKKSWFSRFKDKVGSTFGRSGGDSEEEDDEDDDVKGDDRGRALHPHIVTGTTESGTGSDSRSSLTSGGYYPHGQARSTQHGGQDYGQTQYGSGPGFSQSQHGTGLDPERLRGKKATINKLNFKDETSTTLIAVKVTATGKSKHQITADITVANNAPQGSRKISMVLDFILSHKNDQIKSKVCFSGDYFSGRCGSNAINNPSFDYKLYWGDTCTNKNYLFLKGKTSMGIKSQEPKEKYHNKAQYEIHFSQTFQLFPEVRKTIDRYLKCQLSDFLQENNIGVKNEEGKILVDVNYNLDEQLLDLQIKKPYEDIIFKNIHNPLLQELLFPETSHVMQLGNALIKDKFPTLCILNHDGTIFTFNRVNYEYTLLNKTACDHVLAMDCSPSKLFTVTVSGKPNKKVKVEIFGHTFESVDSVQRYEFLIDGKPNFIEEGQVAVIRSVGTEDRFIAQVSAQKDVVAIKSPPLGLIVRYDRNTVRVTVSEFWKGKLCGLCGEDNGVDHKTFLGPDQCLYSDPNAFAMSYRLPNPQCQSSQPRPGYSSSLPQCLPIAPGNLQKLTSERTPAANCPWPPCQDVGGGGRYGSEVSQSTGGFQPGGQGYNSQISQTSGGFPEGAAGRFQTGSHAGGYGGGGYGQDKGAEVSQSTGGFQPGGAGYNSQISQTSGGFPEGGEAGPYNPDITQTTGQFHNGAHAGGYGQNAEKVQEEAFTAQKYTPLGSSSDIGGCYNQRNLIKRRTESTRGGSERQFCVSSKTVRQCRPSCLAVDFSPETIQFQCYLETSTQARELSATVEQGPLQQIPNSLIKFDEDMMIPQKCIPKY